MAVKSASQNKNLDIAIKDFKVKYYFELVPIRIQNLKNDLFKICKFYDYAPMIFKEIRNNCNVSDIEYLQSIGPQSIFDGLLKAQINTLQELVSSGKSGSFFYYSYDGKYILKTIHRHEFHFLRAILKNYYEHLVQFPNTMIIKFFGLHKMRLKLKKNKQQKIYFIVMQSVFQTYKEINTRYDIKGSLYKRFTPANADPSIAKKDLDILRTKFKLNITKDQAQSIHQNIKNDSVFFEQNDIIDYSLLIGVHESPIIQNVLGLNQNNMKESVTIVKSDNNT